MLIKVKHLGIQDYQHTLEAMREFTQSRTAQTQDELWIVEHPPVYTLGVAGKRIHLLNTGNIPVIQTDRGGQVTYHGPGQAIVYTLLDVKRLNLNSRELVSLLEDVMIATLASFGIQAQARSDAPGVYVGAKKIGSIGMRIKANGSYHGLSLNNNMDLSPFRNINPCGYQGLEVTQLADFGITLDTTALADLVAQALTTALT